MADSEPLSRLARELEPDFKFVDLPAHYDGVYYYAIAIDPLARGEAHRLIDLAPHRYGHPGMGWAGWILSLGNPHWAPQALLLAGLAGMAVATFLSALIATRLGATAWAALAVALNPGLIFGVTTDTAEPLSAAILAAAIYAWMSERRVVAYALLTVVCFFKFQLVLIPIGIALFELVRFLQGERDRDLSRRLAGLAFGPVAFLLWSFYVQVQLDEAPTSLASELLSLPFLGFFSTLNSLGQIHTMDFANGQIAAAQVPILSVVMVIFVIGIALSARLKTFMHALFLLQGLLVLCLNHWNLYYPKDMLRAIAIPLLLLLAVAYTELKPGERPGTFPED